jgi:membrane-bound lytic murein transglycosylase D
MKHLPLASLLLATCTATLVAGCSMATYQKSDSAGSLPHSVQSDQASAMAAPKPIEIPGSKWELSIPDHYSVEIWVKRFAGERHRSFQTQLLRAIDYSMPAQEIFEQRGVPKDLVYVALIESGFSPKARSHANAVGMWQFISSTGKRFGLEQNQWIDERCHPMKAARAAADYLSFLYDTFGSWSLALAAYNAGEKAVQGALDQSGFKTFWDLAANGYLPEETRDYVPKVFAAVKIIRNPRHYGFWYNPGQYVPKHETVPIPGRVKLSWVGEQIGVPAESLQDCNPELCKPVTPPWCSSYDLCVPLGKGEDLLAALTNRPIPVERPAKNAVADKPETASSYKVKPGDSWYSLAKKHQCSAQTLAALNGGNPSRPPKPGQTLKLPAGKPAVAVAANKTKSTKDKVMASAKGNSNASNSAQKLRQPVQYRVRKGDTLASIAERHDIPLKTLCAQNKLSANQKLVPGNRLTIQTR